MPTLDVKRNHHVPIEFIFEENFAVPPPEDRVSFTLVTAGKASVFLNGTANTVISPCVLCLGPSDTISLTSENRFLAETFSFNPIFLNSNLTLENLARNEFTQLEDQHDRNMMRMFLRRDPFHNGIMDIPPDMFLQIKNWMSVIKKEVVEQTDAYWTCRIRRHLLQSLYLLDDLYMTRESAPAPYKKTPVDLVKEYIHTNYQHPISLDSLCKIAYVSRTTLNQQFKKDTGLTAIEYLLSYRLQISIGALTHTNLTVAEISEATGFHYDTYFIKQFTEKIGVSPTEYRRNNEYWSTRYRWFLDKEKAEDTTICPT